MSEKINMQIIKSERVGNIESITIERIYETDTLPEPRSIPVPMVHQDYDALPLEVKVQRLETVAKLYLGWHGCSDPALALREDCTRYWEEMRAVAVREDEE